MTTPANDKPLDPNSPTDKDREQTEQPLTKLPTNRLPTPAELRARGWKELKSTGKGYGLPLSGPLPKKTEA